MELRAQIERALAMGVRPTHLDSHQYRLIFNGKELFDAMLRVAHEYKLPIFVTRDWFVRPSLFAGEPRSRPTSCWTIRLRLKRDFHPKNGRSFTWLR